MRKRVFIVVVCALCGLVIAEDVVYERDGRGRLTGKIIRVEEGAVLPVTGALSVSSLVLPEGAATEDTLLEIKGRLNEALEVEPATTATFSVGIVEDSTRINAVSAERVTVTGYDETSKVYSGLKKIKVFIQTASKKVRLAIGGNDTSNNYIVIDEEKALGWTSPDVNFDTFDIKLKGDTDTDTAVVVIEAWGTK